MGSRGPRAKPVQRPVVPETAATGAQPWQKRGLSRSERVIKFIETLPITQGFGAGENMTVHPFQKRIIGAIYGRSKVRRVRTALVTMPRKSGKSTLSSALVLAHLLGPEVEPRGQIFSAATDRQQAAIIFNEICAMLDKRPALAQRCHIQLWQKTITDVVSGSVYQALSSDVRKAHGLNPSVIICDELAQWRSRSLYDNLVTGTGGRAEPLTVVISTRSADPNHLMSELVAYGEKVSAGIIVDPTFSSTIFAANADADWLDEAVWLRCNPAIKAGFRSLDEMRVAAQQAQRMPAREAVFRNLYLNMAVDTSSDRFVPLPEWQACAGELDLDGLRGKRCWGGLDLSSTQDLTALTLFFPEDGGQVLSWFWAPKDRLQERQDSDHAPYLTWHAQGLLEAPAGRAIDRRAIALRLADIASRYHVETIAYDRWRIEDLQHVLSDEGITLNLEPFGAGYRDMGPAIDALEAAILNRELRHGGHPILTWCISNCIVTMDPAGGRKFDKQRAIEKIDGAVALAMAVGVHAKLPPAIRYDFGESLLLTA